MVENLHSFVVGSDGQLKRGAKDVALIRDYLSTSPDTRATFKLRDITGVYPTSVRREHIDLIGSWEFSEKVRTGRERIFVNPLSDHSYKFPSLVLQCECGAIVSRARNKLEKLEFEEDHREDCLSFYRHKLRYKAGKLCYEQLNHLLGMGWSTGSIADKLACSVSTIRGHIRRWNIDIESLRSEFRRKAHRTYWYLVHERGVDRLLVADIYGVSDETLRRWGTS